MNIPELAREEIPSAESLLPQILVRRQHLISSSNSRRNLMIETSTLLQEDNESAAFPSHGGSKRGKRPNLPCDFDESYSRLQKHYFSDTCLYSNILFQRQF